MDISVETYQTFLDDAWDAAPQQANGLRDQLRAFEKQITPLWASGSLAAVAKNSTSQSYRGPGVGSYTSQQVGRVWRELINLFDHELNRAKCLLALNPQPNPLPSWWPTDTTDATIYRFMKYRLKVIIEFSMDMTYLRLQPTWGILPQGAFE